MDKLINKYELRGELIGDLENGFIDFSLFKTLGFVYIWNFRVSDENLGTGLAESLFNELIKLALKNGIKTVTGKFSPDEGKEKRAASFFKKMGFSIDDNGNMLKELIKEG